MKNIFRICVLIIVILVISSCFVSCGQQTLKGTYRSPEVLGSYTTYEFKGNKVVVERYRFASKIDSDSFEGKYEIEDGEITFTYKNKDGEKVSEKKPFEELDDGSLRIGAMVYERVDG